MLFLLKVHVFLHPVTRQWWLKINPLILGYEELQTHRVYLTDFPTHGDKLHTIPLDGVGATFTLAKAQVHREGGNFPAYTFQHEVETEGFAKMAKALGFGVFGLPAYLIYHINNS
jgi:hypothetical protein